MKVLNNQLYVEQGETFTLDFKLQNKDGAPYIISHDIWDESRKAYFVVTVTSKSPEAKNKYYLDKWCEIDDSIQPTFYVTQPVEIYSKDMFVNNFTTYLGYARDAGVNLRNYAVFCVNNTATGEYEYFYYNDTEGEDVSCDSSKIQEYSCDFITSFSNEITKEWTYSAYIYSINIVAGKRNPKYDGANISDEDPIENFDVVLNIMPPTDIQVSTNNIKGLRRSYGK